MKILFLGYNTKQTKLINFLKKKKISVIQKNQKILPKEAGKFDLIICFGYRKIITNKILKKVKRPIINLHMAYLPYNRGTHPNFWSFYEGTKGGVTIHEIDKKIDTGPIIFQKELKYNIKKNKKMTFNQTYRATFLEMEKLFIKNYKSIILNNYKTKKNYASMGTYHQRKDLPKNIQSWNISIFNYLNNQHKHPR
tara:strand:+ start:1477 stop:2061 length:585 start_codon:yes stop_codon:yes gene_type:complete